MNYLNTLSKRVYALHSENFQQEEVKKILELENDGYNRDSSVSTGNTLVITRLKFLGEKGDGSKIDYDQKFYAGINMWVTDNFKGKSSLFKIMKFGLTGRDKIDKLVKSWLHKISLEFIVGEMVYTTVIDLTKSRTNAQLYNLTIDDFNHESGDKIEKAKEFEVFNGTDFETMMENFFFKSFSYYALKYASSIQQQITLKENALSWATYFSAIYLESKDSTNLAWGNQPEKTFQMLLGLDYTNAVNQLEIKKKTKQRDLQIEKENQARSNQTLQADIIKLQNDHKSINERYNALMLSPVRSDPEFEEVSKLYDTENIRKNEIKNLGDSIGDRIFKKDQNKKKLQRDLETKKQEIVDANKQLTKIKRELIKKREYIEAGIFFSNLSVKSCPHCEHEVPKEKILVEATDKICALCNYEIGDKEVDTAQLEKQISELETEEQNLQKWITDLEKGFKTHGDEIEKIDKELVELNSAIAKLREEYSAIDKRVKTLSDRLTELIKKPTATIFREQQTALLTEKIGIEVKLEEKEKQKINISIEILEKKQNEIDVLETGLNFVKKDRATKSKEIIEYLEISILSIMQECGVKSITNVRIDNQTFNLKYYKNDLEFTFEEISEGEKLRAKLALYLSIIELDIDKQMGRHPRLIMLDSPSKEEGDHHFTEGLIEALQKIEIKFGNDIQIMVGTANRELKAAVKEKKKLQIKEDGEYLF